MSSSHAARTRLEADSITACIIVDGNELPLYGAKVNGHNASCWIASEPGKNFSVRWKIGGQYSKCQAKIIIDGATCAIVNTRAKQLGPDTEHWSTRGVCRTSPSTYQAFTFARIETTDDDAYLDQTVTNKLGTIVIKFREVEELLDAPMVPVTFGAPDKLLTKVHERSKKGLGHQMKLGEPTQCKVRTMTRQKRLVRKLSTFVFKYRSRDHLQAEGKLLPLPSVNGVKQISNLEDPTSQRIRQLEAELEEARREHEAYNKPSILGRGMTSLSREPSAARSITLRETPLKQNEVIDLTALDSD